MESTTIHDIQKRAWQLLKIYVGEGEHLMITTTTLSSDLTGRNGLTLPVSGLSVIEGEPLHFVYCLPTFIAYLQETECHPPVSCIFHVY